jgi:hypothetical protein
VNWNWALEFSGQEMVVNAVSGFAVTAAGVFLAIWANGWLDRKRERAGVVTTAGGLLQEFSRMALDNAPLGGGMMETLWPRSVRAIEIIDSLAIIDVDMPDWFRGEVYVFLDAGAARARGREPATTDLERVQRELGIASELGRAIRLRRERGKQGWYAANVRERTAPEPRSLHPQRGYALRQLRSIGRCARRIAFPARSQPRPQG